MSKSKLTAVVNAYKARHQPTKPRKNYKHYVVGLASELEGLSIKPFVFGVDLDYFQSYVYVYLNPLKPGRCEYLTPSGRLLVFDFKPFYVGKGFGRRSHRHLIDATEPNNRDHKCRTIRKIWAAGEVPIIHISKSRMSDFMAQAYEIDWIAGIGRHNTKTGPLTNGTDGGEGSAGAIRTNASIRKSSNSRRKYWKNLSPEKKQRHVKSLSQAKRPKMTVAAKNHLSKVTKGKSKPEGFGDKIRKAKLGVPTVGRRAKGYTMTQEERCVLSAACSNKPNVKCPHCDLIGKGNTMHRWHFENCKRK